MRLIQTSAPTVEPLTLAEAKLHLRVDITDDDALISGLITSARMVCETLTSRSFITQTWIQYLDEFPFGGGYFNREIRRLGPSEMWLPSTTAILELPLSPVQSVTSITYYDYNNNQNTIDPAIYWVSLGDSPRIQPVYGKLWPIARPQIDSIQITFVVGYGGAEANVPEPVRTAMKLLIGHWYMHREAVSDVQLYDVPKAVNHVLSPIVWGRYS